MRAVFFTLLLVWSPISFAGGDSSSVLLTSLETRSDDSYLLKYRNLDKNIDMTVSLEFTSFQYLLLDFLSKENFNSSINLLKNQLEKESPSRLGSFGGGPCKSEEEGIDLRSDAAQIVKEFEGEQVVYLFCEYK